MTRQEYLNDLCWKLQFTLSHDTDEMLDPGKIQHALQLMTKMQAELLGVGEEAFDRMKTARSK